MKTILILALSFLASTFAYADDLLTEIEQMPKQFRFQPGKTFVVDGVNCHSTTFNRYGLLSYPSHVGGEELRYVLSRLCRPVSEPDVGVFAVQGGTFHSYLHLDSHTVFEKKDLNARSPYRVLNRGRVNNTEYFQCSRIPKTCQDRAINERMSRVHLVGIYLANIANGRVVLGNLSKMRSYLTEQRNALRGMRASANCEFTKNFGIYRAESMEIWMRTLSLNILTRMRRTGGD